jgi:chromosomal replication initiation ATPase DnaA
MTTVLHQTISTPTERLFAEQRRERLKRLRAIPKPPAPFMRDVIQLNPPEQHPIENQQIAAAAEIMRLAFADRVAVASIKRVVAAHFEISVMDLTSRRRLAIYSWPRQIAFYIAKTITPHSLPEIGRQFGNRDHTTVLYAVRKVAGRMNDDEHTKLVVEKLIEKLKRV